MRKKIDCYQCGFSLLELWETTPTGQGTREVEVVDSATRTNLGKVYGFVSGRWVTQYASKEKKPSVYAAAESLWDRKTLGGKVRIQG